MPLSHLSTVLLFVLYVWEKARVCVAVRTRQLLIGHHLTKWNDGKKKKETNTHKQLEASKSREQGIFATVTGTKKKIPREKKKES